MAPDLLNTVTATARRLVEALRAPIAAREEARALLQQRESLKQSIRSIEDNRVELLSGQRARLLSVLTRLPHYQLAVLPVINLPAVQQTDPLRPCARTSVTARALAPCAPTAVMKWLLGDAPAPRSLSEIRTLGAHLDTIEAALFALASHLLRAHSQSRLLIDTLNQQLDTHASAHIPLLEALLDSQRFLSAPDHPSPTLKRFSIAA